MGARETALNVLIACRKNGAWSNGILKEYIARDGLEPREAALSSRLCYGVLQNRNRLDFYLGQLSNTKLKNLHPAVRDILHLGLYQLLDMDKIPSSAAVNESVILAKKYCKKFYNAPAFVNAVLRNFIRNKDKLEEPKTLSDRYSHPQPLVDLLKAYVGEPRLEKMLEANNRATPTVAQVNTVATDMESLINILAQEGVCATPHSWMPDCLILSETGNLECLPSFQKGLFYIQDAAAKLSVLCAKPEKGWKVLDCCAAPGGKSYAAAIAMEGTGEIISCDIHPHKIALIENGARRLGISNLKTQVQDASVYVEQWYQKMDLVIADVPCSGYGIIRKKPDIRYKDPDTMKELPQLQLEILLNQSRYVKPGGILMYSTCTLVRRENEGVIEKFLKQTDDFVLEALSLPALFSANTSGMHILVPGEFDTDGFFIARLRRKL